MTKVALSAAGVKDQVTRKVLTNIIEFLQVGDGQRRNTSEVWLKRKDLDALIGSSIQTFWTSQGGAVGGTGGLPGGVVVDVTPPDAPTGLDVIDGFDSIFLTWDISSDQRVGQAVIYRASTDDRGTAVAVGTTYGNIYSDAASITRGQTYYYWIRYTNRWDNTVLSAWNDSAGTPGMMVLDPAVLLDALSGEITESELYQSLLDRINLIDAPTTGLVDQILAEIQARTAADDALDTDITSINVTLSDGTSGLVAAHDKITLVTGRIDSVDGANKTIEALASQVNALQIQADAGDDALATAAYNKAVDVETRINSVDGNSTTIETMASDFESLVATVEHPTSGLSAVAQSVSDIDLQLVSIDGNITANANAINQLGVEVNGNSVAIQTESTARITQTGELYGQYTLKIDANGAIAGFGLASTANTYNDTVHTSAHFAVDRFSVGAPGAETMSFVIDGTKVVMDGAFIKTASINDAAISTLAVTKLVGDTAAFVSANITDGSITNAKIGQEIKSSNWVDGSQGWRINKDGNAVFHNIYARGNITATSLDVTKANIVHSIHLRADIVDSINIKGNAVFVAAGAEFTVNRPADETWVTLFNLPVNTDGLADGQPFIVDIQGEFKITWRQNTEAGYYYTTVYCELFCSGRFIRRFVSTRLTSSYSKPNSNGTAFYHEAIVSLDHRLLDYPAANQNLSYDCVIYAQYEGFLPWNTLGGATVTGTAVAMGGKR